MNYMTKKHDKKTWMTPEIKKITEFDVHENVVTTSITPVDPFNKDKENLL